MVALLFRTLDAFRIFDSIFVMTGGANGTETVSFLAYRQTIARLEIGLGSAVSVLLFLCVVLICVVLHQGLQGRPGRRRGGRADVHGARSDWWIVGGVADRHLRAVPDRLDRLAVASRRPRDIANGQFLPTSVRPGRTTR